MSKHINIGTANVINQKKIIEKIWASLSKQCCDRKIMSSPHTTTITTSATITSPRYWRTISRSGGSPDLNYIDCDWATINKSNTLKGSAGYLYSENSKKTSTPTYNKTTQSLSFVFDGRYLEFLIQNGSHLIKIDGEFLSLTPVTAASSGITYWYHDFGSRKKRHIEYFADSSGLISGIYTQANDSVFPYGKIEPKVVVLGDSFIEGTGTVGSLFGIASSLSEFLGWPDVINAGQSGTGYLKYTSGSSLKYRDRVAFDVINANPDIVIVCGSINDLVYTPAGLLTESRLLISQIKTSLPDAFVFMTSPTFNSGPSKYTANLISHRDTLKQVSIEYGCSFIDWLEFDIPETKTIPTGVITTGISAGSNTFTSNDFIGSRVTVKIGTDYVLVKGVSGSSPGPFTYAIDGTFLNSHTTGDNITVVGSSLLTGTGNTGSLSGYGNCDLYISSDGIHPTIEGADAFGLFIAKEIIKKLYNTGS